MPVKRASAVRTTKANVCKNPFFSAKSLEVGMHGLSSCRGAGVPPALEPFSILQVGSPDEKENSVSIRNND